MMRKFVAEGLGTALLLVGVVGSGIMGQTLADGNTAIALLANGGGGGGPGTACGTWPEAPTRTAFGIGGGSCVGVV
mgnify:CR=1 FL=1